MLLEISRACPVGASPANTWALLRDVPRLSACIPNVSEPREIEPETRYAATIADKLGPFTLRVPVEIAVLSVEEPRRILAELTGADARGQARVRGTLEGLVEPAEQGAQLTLRMKLEILGKLATLGAGPMRRRADEIFSEFVRRVQAELAAPERAPSSP